MTLIDFDVDTVVYPGFKSHWGVDRYVFSKQTEDLDQNRKSDDIDGSTWGTRFENMLAGPQKAETKISGMHSAIRGQIGDILDPMVGRSTPVLAWNAHESLNVLAPITFQPATFKEYSIKSKRKEVVKFDATLGARGAFNTGFILVSPKSNTTMLVTGTGLDDDSTLTTGATSFGGVIQMHMYDLAGGTTPSVTVVVQHSPDGTTWATLGSFVAATNLTAATTFVQRVKIPSTTTVNAHVRAQWTTTGTPTSCQALVMYDRGIDPDL